MSSNKSQTWWEMIKTDCITSEGMSKDSGRSNGYEDLWIRF